MELNRIEFLAMNNPIRRFLQRRFEMRTFAEMLAETDADLHGKRILDAGCGSGYGLELIHETFSPGRLVGFDLMPAQVERARARKVPSAEIRVGDITQIAEPDEAFDGIFIFGILHHVPPWREALHELFRVLAPGGVLLDEEIHGTAVAIQDKLFGTSHPREAAFDWPDFRSALKEAGFEIARERPLVGAAAHSFLARKPG